MRAALTLVLLLAGGATDPAPATSGIARGQPAPGPRRVAQNEIPISAGPAAKPHAVLEDMTATARQITIFGKVPTNEDVDADLRKRAAELNASRIIGGLLCEHGPMTTRDVTAKVMEARGLNLADAALVATLRLRVGASLRGNARAGEALVGGEGGCCAVGVGLHFK